MTWITIEHRNRRPGKARAHCPYDVVASMRFTVQIKHNTAEQASLLICHVLTHLLKLQCCHEEQFDRPLYQPSFDSLCLLRISCIGW
jgi:hypothetical protein